MAAAKAFVSDFSLSLAGGLMEASGELVSPLVTNSKKSEFKSACPVCAEGGVASDVKQGYTCDKHPGLSWTTKELAKQTATGGQLVDKGAIAEAKASELPENVLEIDVYRRADVEHLTLAAGQSYVFRPGKGKLYPVLKGLLQSRPDLAFMGQCNIRNEEKLMLVTLGFGEQILVTQLAWPADLREFAVPDVPEVKPVLITAAEQLIEKAITDFEPGTYVKGSKARLHDLVEAANDGVDTTPAAALRVVKPDTSDDDLAALLLASIDGKAA